MVFQDPFSSINPAYRVSHADPARARRCTAASSPGAGAGEEAERVLGAVGLVPAGRRPGSYPHELSGGQRQRIGFAARRSPYKPKLIVADEPVSMLDVSIRIGLLNLMSELREREGVSFLYITHDIASARYVADRVLVMYAGHIVEEGPIEDVIRRPKHPYTQLLALGRARPARRLGVSRRGRRGRAAEGHRPEPGCRFRGRCPLAIDDVRNASRRRSGELGPGRLVACHVAEADAEDAALERV